MYYSQLVLDKKIKKVYLEQKGTCDQHQNACKNTFGSYILNICIISNLAILNWVAFRRIRRHNLADLHIVPGRQWHSACVIAQQYISTSFSSQRSYRLFELQQTSPTPAESLPDRGTVHEIMQNIWALDWTSTPPWDTHTLGCVFFTCVYVRACLRVCWTVADGLLTHSHYTGIMLLLAPSGWLRFLYLTHTQPLYSIINNPWSVWLWQCH